jgi:hypothetical protein
LETVPICVNLLDAFVPERKFPFVRNKENCLGKSIEMTFSTKEEDFSAEAPTRSCVGGSEIDQR